MAEIARTRSLLFLVFYLWVSELSEVNAATIRYVSPKMGSLNGETRLTIDGSGFSANQYSAGNTVQLVSQRNEVDCPVLKDGTTENQITCYTPQDMSPGSYYVRVSVDGNEVPLENHCNGNPNGNDCRITMSWANTPTINRVEPASHSSLPGEKYTLYGKLFSGVYGSNIEPDEILNGVTERILRVYANAQLCSLKGDNDTFYGIDLDNEGASHMGSLKCQTQGTFVGNTNASFIIEGQYGRSYPDPSQFRISRNDEIYMFQTYAMITDVTPSKGSIKGGTLITIFGQYFDETNAKAIVLVGGASCEVVSLSDSEIVCKTPEQQSATRYAGNRGLHFEQFSQTQYSYSELHMIDDLSTDASDYTYSTLDDFYFFEREMNYYVTRTHGYFVPPHSGKYTLHIKCDDRAELYFSTDENPANKAVVAQCPGYTTGFFQYDVQSSNELHLEKDKNYYIAVLHAEDSLDASVHVAARHLNTQFSSGGPSADKEEQKIEVTSTVAREIQEMTISDLTTGTAINEVQEVIIEENAGSLTDATFQLGLYGVYTTRFQTDADGTDIGIALGQLALFHSSESVTVTSDLLESGAPGTKLTVTFVSDRGDFPDIQVKTNRGSGGENFTITITEITKGVPSGDFFTVSMANVPSPLIPAGATVTEIQSAMDDLFSTRCPEFLTNPASSTIFYDYETQLPDGIYGSRTNVVDPFCGKKVAANLNYLYRGSIKLTSLRSTLCFAYQGRQLQNYINLGYTYEDVARKQHDTYTNIAVMFETKGGWHYICINLLEKLKDIHPKLSFFWIKTVQVYKSGSAGSFYIDNVYLGKESPVAELEDANSFRMGPARPNRATINSVSVTSTGTGVFEITLVPYNCGSGFPLFKNIPGQFSPEGTVSFKRLQPASPPISGNFSVTFKNKTKSGITYDLDSGQLKTMLQTIEGIGTLDVTKTGNCANFQFTVVFKSLAGNQPEFQVDTSTLHGHEVSVTVSTLKDGSLWYNPIPGDMLRTDHSLPQVTVDINNIPSVCNGSCSFEWDVASTPTITSISPDTGSSGTSVVITGSSLGPTSADNNVTIGGIECTITSADSTSVTCTVGQGSYGSHPVQVAVNGKGNTDYDSGVVRFQYLMSITGISPTTGSLGGGIPLTINGDGFSSSDEVSVGGNVCEIISATPSQILCELPPFSASSVDVSVTANGHTETSTVQFTYNAASTATITSVSPTLVTVEGGETLTITGTNFGTSGTLKIGNTEVPTDTFTDTEVTVTLPCLPPGVYNLILAGIQGAAVNGAGNIPTIDYQLKITNVLPRIGSKHGGTRLTLTGQGFSSNMSLIEVTVGSHPCEVETATSTEVTCTIQSTAATVDINNQGVHPSWGVGYQWNPDIAHAEVGDFIHWTWTTPFWIKSFTHRVEQAANETATEPAEGGFVSGQVGTANGQFTHHVTTEGVYYYWSGFCDNYQIVSYRGTLIVNEKSSFTGEIDLKVAGESALHHVPSGSTSAISSTGPCPETYDGINNCQPSMSSSSSSNFEFVFDTCSTPVVTAIDKHNGTTEDTIAVTGYGFSSTACNNEVSFGDASCIVTSSTYTEIFCKIDPSNSPTIGVMQDISVRVSNLGHANIAITSPVARTFVLEPVVTEISPEISSINGGLVVAISGSGFQGNRQNILVSINGIECTIESVTYTEITCKTPPSSAGVKEVEVKVITNGNILPAACKTGICQLVYEPNEMFTPKVSDINPKILDGTLTTVVITGSGFSDSVYHTEVKIGGETCNVNSVQNTEIGCSIMNVPAGTQNVDVVIANKGKATNSIQVTSSPLISNVVPSSGSIYGGTLITLTGNGFVNGSTSVTVDGSPCDLEEVTLSDVICTTAAHSAGTVDVVVVSNGITFPSAAFNYSSSSTPVITSISPSTGTLGTEITISGSNFGTMGKTVLTGDAPCEIISSSPTEIICTAGAAIVGQASVSVHVEGQGFSNIDVMFEFQLTVSAVTKNAGSVFGGQTVTITGSGFDTSTSATICGEPCTEDDTATQTPSQYVCVTPPSSSNGSQVCDLVTSVTGGSQTLSGGYTYDDSLTPTITSVDPPRGGTGGGVTLTITGSGFGTNPALVDVTIAGTPCTVTSVTDNQILCTTGQHTPSQKTSVRVEINGNGIADQTNAGFYYVDVWSSPFTWGGGSPPEDDTLVVIPAGNVILLDQNTNRLKMVLIKGGELIFDEKDVELFADNILIVEGGRLQIGTEDEPFQHKAIITGTAHLRSKELPIYGTNSIGVREGILDLHGQPVPIVWDRLAQTADAGSSTIILQRGVTWKAGDEIVIASTGDRNSQNENEMRTIQAVAADMKTITLTESLDYKHVGVSEVVGSHTLEFRAEVGLLTRNIVLRGETDPQWTEVIEACPAGFNTGEFATQTCFQGRFGEEIGSDQFGLQVMLHPPEPNKDLAIGRVSYVEFTYVGQAFRLGRYPFHFHLGGNMSESYIKGCAIHKAFNRAVNLHGTHDALVENNVIYNVMGGAFFLEDGIETYNKIQYNLAVFVKESTSLLNDDVTPAAYWVTNPKNIIQHNTAAGGSHFGFWYRMHDHPDGPSRTDTICPKKELMGVFENNTAHSLGWYGLWVFTSYFPKDGGSCHSSIPTPAIFRSLFAWNCKKGSETVETGAIQIHDFILANNKISGHEHRRATEGEWYAQDGPMLKNGLIVGRVAAISSDEQGCTNSGVKAPFDYGYMIDGTEFANFNEDSCAAIGWFSKTGGFTGGFLMHTKNLQFTNVGPRHRGQFRWDYEAIVFDNDGTLTGTANTTVVPYNNATPSSCTPFEGFSHGEPAVMCPEGVRFLRFSFNNLQPSSLGQKDIKFTNQYGTAINHFTGKRITHMFGWMILLVANETYEVEFEHQWYHANISFSGTMGLLWENDFVIIKMYMSREPDCVNYGGGCVTKPNITEEELDGSIHHNTDWMYNSTTKTFSYLVSGRNRVSMADNPHGITVGHSLQTYTCFYWQCIVPVPIGDLGPSESVTPDRKVYWSNASTWFNNTLPGDNDTVIIERGTWRIGDAEIPPLYSLIIYGVLELDQGDGVGGYRDFIINTTYLVILGGRLIIGWENQPFLGSAQIVLQGNKYFTSEFILPGDDFINIGSKVIGVYGGLELHGNPTNTPWTTLNTTIEEGTSTITINGEVDWKVGNEIVIAPTGYNSFETETFKITAISSADGISTIILNATTEYKHWAYSDGTVTVTAEVGLLTRNIQIEGGAYEKLYNESFGGRIIIGDSSLGRGYARITNVEFYHMGQYGFQEPTDPRYAIAFLDSGPITSLNPSYIRNSAFHNLFAPALGVYNAPNLPIENNVFHHCIDYCIQTATDNTQIRQNMIVLNKWKTGQHIYEGAISAMESSTLVLQGNRVSGAERIAYHVPSLECTADRTTWYSDNVARTSIIGVSMLPEDTEAHLDCNRISGFLLVKCEHYGVYVQSPGSYIMEDLVVADSQSGIFAFIMSPDPKSHVYQNDTVIIKDVIIYGTTPAFDCDTDILNTTYEGVKDAETSTSFDDTGRRIGIVFSTFNGGTNKVPKKPFSSLKKYQGIMGLTAIQDVTFNDFYSKCGKLDFTVASNRLNDDGAHPVEVSQITLNNVLPDNKVHIHRPNIGKINSADCVDMDCDGLKKSFLKDLDGTFLGSPGAALPQSEWEWNGDPRRGLGDYRVPKTMQTELDGTRIPIDELAPIKGIFRENECIYHDTWQAYECHQYNYELLTIESMDSDTETRRLSPVAILGNNDNGDGCLDLVNGPQDHGWCSGYACRKRLSTFQAIVATGKYFLIHFTSVTPQKMRYMLLNTGPTEGMLVGTWYSRPDRLDVYYQDQHVMPVNGRWHNGAYILDPPPAGQTDAYIPNMSDSPGTNWFDRDSGILYIMVKGPESVSVMTVKQIIVSYKYPAMSVTEFYGEKIVEYLAAFFDLPPDKVRFVDIVSADQSSGRRRKRRSTDYDKVIIEISDTPSSTYNETTNSTLSDDQLQLVYAQAIEEAQLGNFSAILNATVIGVEISKMTPDPSSEEWAAITTSDGYRVLVTVDHLDFHTKITPFTEGNPFTVQPKITTFDSNGNRITELGTSVYPWYVTASVRDGTGNPSGSLFGNTTIPFINGWANFTNIGIDYKGTGYIIDFNITYPERGENLTLASDPIDVAGRPLRAVVVTPPENVVQSTKFQAGIGLYDEHTGERITNIEWNGLTWHVTASIPMPELYNGTLDGVMTVNVDPSTSEASFNFLKLSELGMAAIKFHVKTTPEVYDLYVEHLVPIRAPHHLSMTVEETTEVILKSNADFDTVIGDMGVNAASMLGNWFCNAYPEIRCDNVSVSRGSIVVTLTVSGTHDDVNSTLYSACSVLSNGQSFTFKGNTFSLSNSMVYNGSTFYGGDCYVAPYDADDESESSMVVIIAAVCCVVCVTVIVVLLVLWKLKIFPKTKVAVDGNGTKYLGNDDLDEILFSENSFMSITAPKSHIMHGIPAKNY